jgi:outer membrane protein TolC
VRPQSFLRLLVVSLLPLPAAAQDPPAPTLTLTAAVERALGRYPALGLAGARLEEAREAVREEEASRRPLARLSATATRHEEPSLVSPIHGFAPGQTPPFDDTLLQGGLNLSYTLLDAGGRAARIRAAGAQAALAGYALAATEQEVIASVAAAYLEALSRRETLAARDQELVALRGELDRAGQLFGVGRAARVDVLRAEAALARATAERVAVAAALEVAERELARLMTAEVAEARAARLQPVALAASAPPARESLIETALAGSPQVAQARHRVAAADAARALARSAFFPQLRANANLLEYASSEGHGAAEWNAGLELRVPLFDGGGTQSRVARATAAAAAARAELKLAEAAVRRAVDGALASFGEARARSESWRQAEAGFAEVARIQQLLLATGAGTQIDYLDAEADAVAARAARTQAEHAAILARVELARVTGELAADWLDRNIHSLETRP